MTYQELEKMFSSEEGLTELLNSYQQKYFTKLDNIANLFQVGGMQDRGVLDNTLDELTGIYMDLNTVYLMSITEKENRELDFYIAKKIQVENEGNKFVSTSAEKEASASVANYRRVRNIFEAKVQATEKAISTCQSRMKSMTKEYEASK